VLVHPRRQFSSLPVQTLVPVAANRGGRGARAGVSRGEKPSNFRPDGSLPSKRGVDWPTSAPSVGCYCVQQTFSGACRRPLPLVVLAAAVLAVAPAAQAALDLEDARKLCRTGHYEDCLASAQQAVGAGAWTEEWHLLLISALETLGRYDAAATAAEALARRNADSLRGLLALHEVRRATGDRRAAEVLERVRKIFSASGARLTGADELVVAGQAALRLGDEPRAVFETYFGPAAKRDPSYRDTYLAAGNLALDNNDDALAARWFRDGLTKLGADADLQLGLARAFQHSDRKEMLRALEAALGLNPRLVPALLLRAEHAVDTEDYAAARRALEAARAVDPGQPLAWAFDAVLAHLRNDGPGEARARASALRRRASNPEVDTLIGRELSRKYRFTEGSAYQRRALEIEPAYLPAKMQLASDLLRLGKEAEGWALVDEVRARDGYDVVAYNLATLHGHIDKMATRKSPDFILRMDPRDAAVWGDAAQELLREARATVDRKYGTVATRPVAVEIFADQGDFAVRTFGLPGGAAYLGVCFGPLITMNSPSGNIGATANWKAVLWHEYTHVVTLGLTHNKMPRWLSEGISVYEEGRRDASWGQPMTARFREMILGGELSPVGKLSGAFLEPKDGEHMMFAYYQSSLVVELIIERYGFAALNALLRDLGRGTEINQALAAHTAPLPELERVFAAFARERARSFGKDADWARPDPPRVTGDKDVAGLHRWLARHPHSVWGLREEAQRLIAAEQWREAKTVLTRLLAVNPDDRGGDSVYLLLASVHRKLGESADERKMLERLAELSGDAQPVYTRLLELDLEVRDWPALARNAERLLAVNPLSASAYLGLGRALEERAASESKAGEGAAAAYGTVLRLEPADPADIHLRLARLLRRRDPRAARRHVLDALSEAPRFRAAHRLLLELHGEAP
jgi:tetratricopeptide (TPR) repeat protein